MKKLLNRLFLFVFFLFFAQAGNAQCYVRMEDASGFNTDPYQDTLEAVAAKLCTIFDSTGFPGQFKVYDFGFYLHQEITNGGYPEPFAQKIAEVQGLSPYYLLFGKQTDKGGVYTRFWVALTLPDNSIFSCLNSTKLSDIVTVVENTTNNAYQKSGGKFYSYSRAEIAGIQKLKMVIEGLKLGNCCPLSPWEIFDKFSKDGFIGTPIQIVGPAAKPSLGDENERNGVANYIADYANLVFKMDGEVVDLMASDVPNVTTAKVYITKNENFCDLNEDIIGTVESGFNNVELDLATWYHIWDNPIVGEPDVILFKQKLKKNSPPNFTVQNQSGFDPIPPSHEYTLYQRSFAPWRRFGHFPWPPPVPCWPTGLASHNYKNSFWGDSRGFTTAKPCILLDSRNSEQVTSRLNQFAKFNLGNGITASHGYSSETRGFRNFLRYKCETEVDGMGNPIGIECGDSYEESTVGQPSHLEKFGKILNITNSYLYLQIEGTDPLVAAAPTIDCQILMYCDPINENGNKYLHIRGLILYKGFPSYEAFIQDKSGKSVFIHTFSPAGESQLDKELLCPSYDYIKRFDMKLQIDQNGNFLDNGLIIGSDQNTYDPTLLGGYIQYVDDPLSLQNFKTPNFSFSTTTITSWNATNTNKNPAGDCSSQPCEGEYPGNN